MAGDIALTEPPSTEAEQYGQLRSFAETLPAKVAVDDERLSAFTDREQFTNLAHLLYQETAHIVRIVASVHEPDRISDRDHAICCGLLVRIWKFMLAIATLTAVMDRCGEIVKALNRCILESAVNLMFLLKKHDRETFDDFVRKSLGPERELFDNIHANIATRGGEMTAMETRMLASIERVVSRSGMKIEDVPKKHQEWAENMRLRLRALESEELYASYRGGSHAIHGTWVDLVISHLECGDGNYAAEFAYDLSDCRLLSPMARITMDAIVAYAPNVLQEPELTILYDRINDLWKRSEVVSVAYETWINEQNAKEGAQPPALATPPSV
jgi:hypothetical protein